MKALILKIYNSLLRRFYFLKRRVFNPKLPQNAGGEIFVNVGCGLQSGKEYTNVDTLPFPSIHHITDIRSLPMFVNNSVSIVYASHVVEHIPRHELKTVIMEWHRILKEGGIFRMSVPNFDNLLQIYKASENQIESVIMQVMGQNPPYNNHYSIWNFNYAEKILKECGFKEVRFWDPKTADHHDFEDRSSRILKWNGTEVPLSLNVEAIK